MTSSDQHEQVTVYIGNNRYIQVDKKLAPLVVELNKLDMATLYCCEGDMNDDRMIVLDTTSLTIEQWPPNKLILRWKDRNPEGIKDQIKIIDNKELIKHMKKIDGHKEE